MKKITLFAMLFVAMFALTACNKKQGDEANNSKKFESRRPDFGQPEEPVDIRGLVSEVVGNEITVLKIERPQFGERKGEGEGSRNNEEDKNEERTRPLSMGGSSGGHVPGMGMRRGMRPGGNVDEDMKAQMLERMKEMASGEEKILIPVGIQMLKPDTESESKEPTMIEATLEDIKADTMLQIWLDDAVADHSVASFVLVMN